MTIFDLSTAIADTENKINRIKYPTFQRNLGYVKSAAMLATLLDLGNSKKQIENYLTNTLAELTQELSDLSDKVSL